MNLVLSTRFEEMGAFRNAALDWSDPKGVHDMRVASRRLRGALGDFLPFLLPYIAKRRLSICRKQIKNIADDLGRVRDYDVAIMTLELIATQAPAEIAGGIRKWAQLRNADREEQCIKLLPALDPEAFMQLKTNFTSALAGQTKSLRPKKPAKHLVSTSLTYQEAAASIILDRLEELEKMSDSLYHPLKTKALHEMRIAAKHLRYALELFEQCWGRELARFAKKVAGLQSSLGKLHDCDVWIEDFGKAATAEQTSVDSDQKATVVWLLNHFVRMRAKHLSKALVQWHQWEAGELGTRLRQKLS